MSCARTVAIGENVGKEVKHAAEVLKVNGYPVHIIRLVQRNGKREQEEERPKYRISLPYVSGLSENLRRILRRFDIRTAFTTISTLRQQLTRVKDVDRPLSKASLVCRVPCSCGREYIGETKRALITHIKEHQSASRRGEQKNLP